MTRQRANGEGTMFYEPGRDRWVGQLYVDHRRRKVTAKTKRDLVDKMAKLRTADAAHRDADLKITVGKLLAEWRAKAVPNRGLAPGTIEVHDWAIAAWTEAIGRRRAAELRPADIERAMAKMNSARPLSQSSFIKLRSTLNQAMAWAVKRGDLPRNPVSGVELPSDLAPRRPKRALSVDEMDHLCAELHGHPLEPVLMLSAGAGLRPGEAAAVTVEAVDLHDDVVKVVQSVQLVGGRPTLSDKLKNAKSRRAVEMREVVADAIRRHLSATGIKSGLLCSAPDGGPLWPSTVRAELAEACRVAGVPVITANELRHTFITQAADADVPPHVLADIVGHVGTRMIDQYYRHRPLIVTGARMMDAPRTAHRARLRAV